MIDSRKPEEALRQLSGDRRDDPRVAIDLSAELTSCGFEFPVKVSIRDLSAGGACIITDFPISLGGVRKLRFACGERTVSLSAEALWQDKRRDSFLTGIRFAKVSAGDQRLLIDLVFQATRTVVDFLLFESTLVGLGRGDALHMAGASRLRKVSPGAWLYCQDRPTADSESIYLVVDGSMRLRTRVRNRERNLADLKRGSIFGGISSLAGVVPPESAIAELPTTLFELDVSAISFLFEQRPWLIHRLTQAVVGDYTRRTNALLEALAQ